MPLAAYYDRTDGTDQNVRIDIYADRVDNKSYT